MAKEKRRNVQSDPRRILNGQNPGQVRKTFAPGQAVYTQGDRADAVFFVESGWVKMSVVAASGKEAVIALRGPGEFFGSRSLIGQPRPASVITLTVCSLVRITTPALMRLLREMPGFAEMFTVHQVRQSIHDQETLVDLLTSSAEQRLARTLLRLADAGRGDNSIPTKISQALFARMIGTTRSRVSVFMTRFKRQGYIEYGRDGRIRVQQSLRQAMIEDWINR
jgi:CRP-like cAMP-binding protein